MEAIRDAELLIGATARAFYPDDCVVVLDALVRDKFIREDEMGARLQRRAWKRGGTFGLMSRHVRIRSSQR